jgi:hypothetical protein
MPVAAPRTARLPQARDEDGNRRLCGGDDVRVALRLREGSAGVAGPVAVAAAVEDRGDGTYEATYLATIAGDYELSITLGARCTPAPGPSAAQRSCALPPALLWLTAGARALLYIYGCRPCRARGRLPLPTPRGARPPLRPVVPRAGRGPRARGARR